MGLINKHDGWRISDEVWAKMEPLLPDLIAHPLGCHNPPVPPRQAMTGILFVLRTGCQWNALNGTGICSSSSTHRWFQRWCEAGVFQEFWKRGLMKYDGLKGIDWTWLSMDGAMSKAPLGGGKNGAQSDGSGQIGHQAQRADRRRWRPRRRRGGWRESA